jgi:hypothetical protein
MYDEWARCETHARWNACKIRIEGLGRIRKDNMKMDIIEVKCGDLDWLEEARNSASYVLLHYVV